MYFFIIKIFWLQTNLLTGRNSLQKWSELSFKFNNEILGISQNLRGALRIQAYKKNAPNLFCFSHLGTSSTARPGYSR